MLRVVKRYAAKAEPTSTTSNTAISAIYNRPDRLLRTGGANVGDGPVCLGACGGTEGPGRGVGTGVLAEATKGDGDIWAVGMYCSAGVCVTGICPVGATDKTGVEDEITGGGGRTGVLLPATIGGTDDAFDSDCWLRYVGLFMVSRESLIPPRYGGLIVSDNGRE